MTCEQLEQSRLALLTDSEAIVLNGQDNLVVLQIACVQVLAPVLHLWFIVVREASVVGQECPRPSHKFPAYVINLVM